MESVSREVEIYQGYVRYAKPKQKLNPWESAKPSRTDIPKRERISCFSPQSRKRLLRECLSIKFSEGFYFVTLTYQDPPNLEDALAWKDDINLLRKSLLHCLPSLSALWKLEFTKKGVPHYHLITHCPDTIGTELRNTIREHWLRISGSGSRGRLKYAVKVDKIDNIQACIKYMANYQTKDENERSDVYSGRYWGYFNRKRFPTGKLDSADLNEVQLGYLRRVLSCVYVSPKYKDVKANLTETDNSFSVYLPFLSTSQLFAPLLGQKCV